MGFAYSLTLHFLSPTIPDPASESTKTDGIAMAMFLPFSTFVTTFVKAHHPYHIFRLKATKPYVRC